ncbi:MAG: hypothetical protein P4L84_11765 [Isosphaeraceae bacterium]|nr:hypothetical protein [Isosphaeraceae bacterium]
MATPVLQKSGTLSVDWNTLILFPPNNDDPISIPASTLAINIPVFRPLAVPHSSTAADDGSKQWTLQKSYETQNYSVQMIFVVTEKPPSSVPAISSSNPLDYFNSTLVPIDLFGSIAAVNADAQSPVRVAVKDKSTGQAVSAEAFGGWSVKVNANLNIHTVNIYIG